MSSVPIGVSRPLYLVSKSMHFDALAGPYNSIAEANSVVISAIREKGREVYILNLSGDPVAHTWRGGIEDDDLSPVVDVHDFATNENLDNYQPLSEKNVADGYAGLNSLGKINSSQLPLIAITDTFVVTSESAMLALTVEIGDVAVRTDIESTFILRESGATVLSNWTQLQTPTDSVTSVFGRTGVVTAQSNDYTWDQIDKSSSSLADLAIRNFSDLQNKPTTVAGYGITDAYNKTESDAKYLLNTTSTFTGNLTVTGNVEADSIKLITGASNGYFLQSDAYGNATWKQTGNNFFEFTWKTDNSGTSNDDQATLPFIITADLDCVVTWGDVDGSTTTLNSASLAGDLTHTYSDGAGTKSISISGSGINGFSLGQSGDKLKILEVSNVGNLELTSSRTFDGCANLTWTATDAPTITSTDLSITFGSCINFNGNIDNWDVSNVTNISQMFQGASVFNRSLNNWDVSNVTTMSAMFNNASVFNGNISSWNVGNVTTMNSMFFNAYDFNQPLNSWDVSTVTDMNSMFFVSSAFNQPLDTWNVSNVTDMFRIFAAATSFNQDVSSWDVNQNTNFGRFMDGVTLSTANYDLLLTKFDAQGAMSFSGTAHFGLSKYTEYSEADTARTSLIAKWGGITDGGSVSNGHSRGTSTYYGEGAGITETSLDRANTGFGYEALYSNTTGQYNSANGYKSLYSNTTGRFNIAMGSFSLEDNTDGDFNVGIGYRPLFSNTTGSSNTAIGYNSLLLNLSGGSNTAIGSGALYSNTTGDLNTAIGYNALKSNTTGLNNVSVGNASVQANTTGQRNVGMGYWSLFSNTTGSYNVGIGNQALKNNTTGSRNIAIGGSSFFNTTTGSYNTGYGFGAGANITTGVYNVALGVNALMGQLTSDHTIGIGNEAGRYLVGGGTNTQSNDSIYIGQLSRSLDITTDNEIVIGSYAEGNGSNTVTIGSSAVTDNYLTGNLQLLSGIINAGTTYNGYQVNIGTTANGSISALGRIFSNTKISAAESVEAKFFSLTAAYTFATLPTGSYGMVTYITDASTISYRADAAGGGTDYALVTYNGAKWIYH
jgi:surface protein